MPLGEQVDITLLRLCHYVWNKRYTAPTFTLFSVSQQLDDLTRLPPSLAASRSSHRSPGLDRLEEGLIYRLRFPSKTRCQKCPRDDGAQDETPCIFINKMLN